jgi:hypothetical protein
VKLPSVPALSSFVRDVAVPASGIIVIVVQLYQPGERWALIVAGLTMMGFPVVAYGARRLDEARNAEAKADE